jgi:voltage-gated potassium channel
VRAHATNRTERYGVTVGGTGDGQATSRLIEWRRRTDGPLLVLAVGSLPFLLLEVRRDQIPRTDATLVTVVNVVVLVAFGVDYLVELALTRDRRRYVRTEWASLGVVIAQGLALMPALTAFGALRVLRAARVFRPLLIAVRVVALGRSASQEALGIVRRNAFRFAVSLAVFTWISAGAAVVVAEGVSEDGYGSLMDGLWWSASTITTVGYGDITPHTFTGRVIGIVTMVVGISTFAIVTAKIAEFLVRTDRTVPPSAEQGSHSVSSLSQRRVGDAE